jgi:hypothetical protein
LKREAENWDAAAVFEHNRYVSPDVWCDREGSSAAGAPFRRRRDQTNAPGTPVTEVVAEIAGERQTFRGDIARALPGLGRRTGTHSGRSAGAGRQGPSPSCTGCARA